MPQSIADIWLDYVRAKSELAKALGCDDYLIEAVGNAVIAKAYGVKQRKADLGDTIVLADGRTVETRAAKRSRSGPIELTAITDWSFDLLAVIVFDEDGYIESASEVAVAQAREVAKFDKTRNCWFISFDDELLGRGFVRDISKQANETYGGRFARDETGGKKGAGGTEKRVEPLSVMRNKDFAMKCIHLLKDNSATLDADISALMDSEYCKQVLEHSFAILKCVTGMSLDGVKVEARDRHGNRRYYESPIPIGNESYIVSNDWYGLGIGGRDNRTPFIKWVRGRVGV